MLELKTFVIVGLAIVVIPGIALFIYIFFKRRTRCDAGGLPTELGFSYHPIGKSFLPPELRNLSLLDAIVLYPTDGIFQMYLADTSVFVYLTGGGTDGRIFVLYLFNENWNIPEVEFCPKGAVTRLMSQLAGRSNDHLLNGIEFSKQYSVRTKHIGAMHSFRSSGVLSFLAGHPGWHIKGETRCLRMYKVKYYSLLREDVEFIRSSWEAILPLCKLFQDAVESSPELRS